VKALMTERRFGGTRACGLVAISRSLYGYAPRRVEGDLKQRIEAIDLKSRMTFSYFSPGASSRPSSRWRLTFS
jgi:hypothetical protein